MTTALVTTQELARLNRQEYEEETRRELKLHECIMSKRRSSQYEKNYALCHHVLNSFIDFAVKIAEYREITEKYVCVCARVCVSVYVCVCTCLFVCV